ncbi:MAG: RsmD family RNA methyltransferase [Bacteroidota bacterium]|nr:RsmD family RNA methyltransferase [Bacteroidota bacterium]MDQ6889371.1 RsmD family RNA methyltransferase [Bacteroidota bacterium]
MRIITGKYGGRKIYPPAKMPYTRPTTDVAKEGLFNILENNISITGLKTLDIFGGTGSITYELASRGAHDLTIVEKDPKMYSFIQKSVLNLEIENCKVVKMDVFRFVENCVEKYDLIFAGPPYALQNIDDLPKLIIDKNLLAKNGWFILEHTPANNYEKSPMFKSMRNYGTTIFSIFINN